MNNICRSYGIKTEAELMLQFPAPAVPTEGLAGAPEGQLLTNSPTNPPLFISSPSSECARTHHSFGASGVFWQINKNVFFKKL